MGTSTYEDISNLAAILGISIAEAQRLLQNNNGDANQAASAFFENPASAQQAPSATWGEPPPYHNVSNNELRDGYRIDTSDPVGSSTRAVPASRPPSRASNLDHMDLSGNHDGMNGGNANTSDQEQRDLQQALQASMNENPPGQENGVTSGGQRFSKVTHEYHDTRNWAMTVSKATAREITENPPAANRQREDGEPAFLRSQDRNNDGSLIPSLLTILHSIPLAREALLFPEHQEANYGYDPQWWTGHPSETSRVTGADGHNARSFDDLINECQRLMAFLDDTRRAYGSIDTLAESFVPRNRNNQSKMIPFLTDWTKNACQRGPEDPLRRVFTSNGSKKPYGEQQSITAEFVAMETNLDPDQKPRLITVLDHHVWLDQTHSDGTLDDVVITGFADVVAIRVFDSEHRRPVGVTVPVTWYPERYMEPFREVAREMRTRKAEMRKELVKIDRKVAGLTTHKEPGEQTTDKISETLIQAAEKAPLVAKYSSRLQSAEPSDGGTFPTLLSEAKDVAKCLRGIVESVEKQVETYQQQKTTIMAQLDELATEFTQPESESSQLKLRYTLRGVSTKPNVTYLLRRERVDEVGEADSVTEVKWQWWRTTSSTEEARKSPVVYGPSPRPETNAQGPYSPWPGANSSKEDGTIISYAARKVSESEVLQAAGEENDAALLVYASEHAVNFVGSPLSPPLRMFVKADNKAFENELRGASMSEVSEETEMTQLHFTNSNGIPIAPMDDDEVPFKMERDMSSPSGGVSAGTSPPSRDLDGQPSPKRAKGKDEPPHYEPLPSQPEMQERAAGPSILGMKPNKIGQLSEKMMNRIRERAEADAKGSDAKRSEGK